MPRFSQRSQDNLSQCHTDLQVLFNEVIKWEDCTVVCGQRGEKEQNEAYEEGKSRLRYPQSKHNKIPSMAVDVVPYPIDWHNRERFLRFGGFVMGIAAHLYELGWIENRVKWGGDWETFKDFPHFEM